MSFVELKMVAEVDLATVPIPIREYALLFVGSEGKLTARLNSGQFVVVSDGAKGDQGLPGAAGAQGLPGAAGAQGLPGADGAQGVPGEKGDLGLPGAKGDEGLRGANGAQGLPGAAGAQGLPGAAGAQGLPGAEGAQGLPGSVASVRTTGLDVVAAVVSQIQLHSYVFAGSLLNKIVRASAMLVANSTGNVTCNVQLSVGGVLINFQPFISNGARQTFVEVEAMIDAQGRAWAWCRQSAGPVGANASMGLGKSASSSGVLATGAVVLRLVAANGLSVATQLASIEVLN